MKITGTALGFNHLRGNMFRGILSDSNIYENEILVYPKCLQLFGDILSFSYVLHIYLRTLQVLFTALQSYEVGIFLQFALFSYLIKIEKDR